MQIELSAWTVGEVASELLAAGSPFTVMGVTSRGVFLRLGQGVIFLSTESYRGPLTVNLSGGLPAGLQVGAEVALNVILSDSEGSLTPGPIPLPPSLKGRGINSPPFRVGPGGGPPSPGIESRLTRMIEHVLAARPEGETSDLLRTMLPLPEASSTYSPPFREANSREKRGGQGVGLLPLLGRGEGLTPWGDDLIIGLLLARYTLQPDDAFRELADELTVAAFAKTSLLSANLIACAARGLADERLLLGLSALLYGEPPVEAGADGLLGWGNTSGVAALAGLAIGILDFTQDDNRE